MSKYLSTDDFLAGILGEEVEYEIEGLGTVLIRSLQTVEVQRLRKQYEDEVDMMLGAVMLGLVEPKLQPEHITQLQAAKPGVLNSLGNRIMQISGMVEDAEKKAGSGS